MGGDIRSQFPAAAPQRRRRIEPDREGEQVVHGVVRLLRVATLVSIEATYDQTPPRVKLSDGTLGIPAEALNSFVVPSN